MRNKSTLPAQDWAFREIVDAFSMNQYELRCDFCNRKIRWIHVLDHIASYETVIAGQDCAAMLCQQYDAEGAERVFKNREERRRRFTDPVRWTQSKSNQSNIWRCVRIGSVQFVITVFVRNGLYGIYTAEKNANGDCCRKKFRTQIEAMNAAFEIVEGMKP